MTDAPNPYPPKGADPQTLNERQLRAAIMGELRRHISWQALRDAVEILMSADDSYTENHHRAPLQCFHCGVVLQTRIGATVHFGETPDRVPLCLAPETARSLLEHARREACIAPPGETGEPVRRLAALIEDACKATPASPQTKRHPGSVTVEIIDAPGMKPALNRGTVEAHIRECLAHCHTNSTAPASRNADKWKGRK
ncbi:LexA repressor [Oceanicaulis alexandrii HTCC2633]|uniref:hypothetical protein n=1 Tax=Oceanicaulis sp. HTCC2633 TaxID=314254 RepID=UPI0000668C85|nr:hypothetical protein [Oceanicaulis sp. HTCC2633]EAP88631.1 LexA repressor [Oceanicaulis alexandrii HTCC2633] [Oceanicaulis sp. HTCC2633]